MLSRAVNRIMSWWAKPLPVTPQAATKIKDSNPFQHPFCCHPVVPFANRSITMKDITFKPRDTYKKDQKEKRRVMHEVLENAPPGASSAVVLGDWHVSNSDKIMHSTVEYTIRAHIYKAKTKWKLAKSGKLTLVAKKKGKKGKK